MIWQVIQCGISIAVGCFVYWVLSDDPNPKVPLFGGLICGFGATWLAMKLYVLARFGWKAMRSMSLDP